MARDAMRIEVKGLKQIQREVRSVDRDLAKEMRAAGKSAAQIIADQGEIEAPKRTGRLAASVKSVAQTNSAAVKAGTAARVPYAEPVHFGWPARGIKANPFLYRAIAKTSDRAAAEYEKKIGELAGRIRTARR